MPKPVCVKCHTFFQPLKSGFYFTEGMPGVDHAKPGLLEPEKWRPYKIWSGDKWQCKQCGAIIIVGFGREPVAMQHQEGFKDTQQRFGADQFQVNDC